MIERSLLIGRKSDLESLNIKDSKDSIIIVLPENAAQYVVTDVIKSALNDFYYLKANKHI